MTVIASELVTHMQAGENGRRSGRSHDAALPSLGRRLSFFLFHAGRLPPEIGTNDGRIALE